MDVLEVRHLASSVQIHSQDAITWDDFRANKVSISLILSSIRDPFPTVSWHCSVWNSFSIPKCSFNLWLILQNRLLTRDKMIEFGMHTRPECLLCNGELESVQHIFIACPFFSLIRNVMPMRFSVNWNYWLNGEFFDSQRSSKENLIGNLFLAVATYYTWKERNFRLHNDGPGHPTLSIIKTVKTVTKEKLFSCKKFGKWIQKDPCLFTLLY